LAAKSGKAVIVKAALDILALVRFSCASAAAGRLQSSPMAATSCSRETLTKGEFFLMISLILCNRSVRGQEKNQMRPRVESY
jgi:hypothetical protein